MFSLLCTLDHSWFFLSLSHPEYFISQVQCLLSASIYLVFDNIGCSHILHLDLYDTSLTCPSPFFPNQISVHRHLQATVYSLKSDTCVSVAVVASNPFSQDNVSLVLKPVLELAPVDQAGLKLTRSTSLLLLMVGLKLCTTNFRLVVSFLKSIKRINLHEIRKNTRI